MDLRKNKNIIKIIGFGICIHILLLVAVFDTYFKSPLERGMCPIKSTKEPAAKRIFIFTVDGLRAQAVFDKNENATKFLTMIRRTRGCWGVSHARIPTETRPNHVAIFAGIYEDPSSVFEGWKEFPVDFDSVFNESKNSWIYADQGVINIFNKYKRNHLRYIVLPRNMVDYETKNQTIIDHWMFRQVRFLLHRSGRSKTVQSAGNIFSLHLCSTDMIGHSHKPSSRQYLDNIKFIDENIKLLENIVNETFLDNATTFIFTADHGMTNWGSHGSGSDEETFTPFIAWGAGIKIDKRRQDIDQISIAPLISALIGLNYPVNSVGKLPLKYLNLPDAEKLHLYLGNIKQVFRILEAKQERMKDKSFFYKPYLTREEFNRTIVAIRNSSNLTNEEVFSKYEELLNRTLKGIDHFNDYFLFTILLSVLLGLFLWILYISTFLIPKSVFSKHPCKYKRLPEIGFTLSGIVLVLLCLLQSLPFTYYFYILFPNITLYLVFEERKKISCIFVSNNFTLYQSFIIAIYALCIVIFIISFYYRFCICIVMVLVCLSIFLKQGKPSTPVLCSWIFLCGILCMFPLFPIMSTNFDLITFVLGYISWQYLNFYVYMKAQYTSDQNLTISLRQKIIFFIQNISFSSGFLISLIKSVGNEDFKDSTVAIIRYLSWILFLVPICLIPLSMSNGMVRIWTIFNAFAPFYIMTTMSYEMIFFTFYTALLIFWMTIETQSKPDQSELTQKSRNSMIFVALIIIGYFGVGNIASISSFDTNWVRCFLTSFRPFEITILIFLKVTLPFLYTACAFRYIVSGTREDLTVCFCIILLIFDIMVFYFMSAIKNVGSWVEIGSSLSRFIVVDCFTMGVLFFYFLAYFLTNVRLMNKLF